MLTPDRQGAVEMYRVLYVGEDVREGVKHDRQHHKIAKVCLAGIEPAPYPWKGQMLTTAPQALDGVCATNTGYDTRLQPMRR